VSQLRREFGKKLKALRVRERLTQEELAEKTQLSASFISSMERGIDAPSFETLERIASVLGVTVTDMFDFGDNDRESASRVRR
jgi:transcriptional regulator with XRE-family HTH domain